MIFGYEIQQTFLHSEQRERNSHVPGKSSSHSFFYHGEQFFTQGPKFLFPWEFLVSVNHFAQYSGPAVVKFLQTSAEQYNLFFLCVFKFSERTRTVKRQKCLSYTNFHDV